MTTLNRFRITLEAGGLKATHQYRVSMDAAVKTAEREYAKARERYDMASGRHFNDLSASISAENTMGSSGRWGAADWRPVRVLNRDGWHAAAGGMSVATELRQRADQFNAAADEWERASTIGDNA